MRKLIYTIAAVGALAWSSAAWAVLQETTITLTDNGKPLPEATITLNRLSDSEPPPEPKTEKTDESGKIVIVHDEEDNTSDSTVELIVHTSEGKTLTRRVVLKEFLISESVDVAAPSETQQASESQNQVPKECLDLTNLDDRQLEILINDPALRARIVKLIEETEQTDETKQTEETKTEETKQTETLQEKKKRTEKKSVSGKSKEKK